MKSYFAYIRVSTVRQGEHGSSLQEQRSAIEAFAKRQNLSIAAWFEEKETAAKQGRAVFARMLAQLERGTAHGVVIHKIDRSARNLRDWAKLGDLIDRGVDVQFAHDNVDLRSRGGRLSADIQAVVAADYIRNLREEVRKGYYGRLKQGLYPLPAPIGYLDTGGGKPKEPDPLRGALVRQAFDLYATGTMGLKGLRLELERRGLRAPHTTKPLSLNGVSRMLNNSFYMGIIHIKRTGETFNGVHEPLVTKSLFERVQAMLKGKSVVRTSRHDYLFRRIVRCVTCNYHLIGENQKGRYTYYRCHQCSRVCVREETLDHAMRRQLQSLEFGDHDQKALKEEAIVIQGTISTNIEQMRKSLRMQVAKCDERLARLTDAYIDHVIDKELFEGRKLGVLQDRRELNDKLASLNDPALLIDQALGKLELANAAYSGYRTGIAPEKRKIIESVTSNFVVEREKVTITLKSPFNEIALWQKNSLGDPTGNRTRICALKERCPNR